MTHDVELLWFADCANHPAARRLLEEVIAGVAPGTPIRDVDATDPTTAGRVRFPGSPTIRVDGLDVDPSYVDPGEYTPRCRLYRTDAGLRGLPERQWIEIALRRPTSSASVDAGELRSPAAVASDDLAVMATGTALTAACCMTVAVLAGTVVAPIGLALGGLATLGAGVLAVGSWRRQQRQST